MTLYALLLKIANGELVNFNQVVKKLPSDFEWNDIFAPELVSPNKFSVQIKDIARFEKLLIVSCEPTKREYAASHQLMDSHAIKCESAYKLIFPHIVINKDEVTHNQFSKLNTLIFLADNIQPLTFAQSKQAVLIENQDCFFRYEKFLKLFVEQLPNGPFDVIFSAGSQILDKRFKRYLEKYERLYCLFDYDYAGLAIFQNISSTISSHCHFLLPDESYEIDQLFTFKPISTNHYLRALNLANVLNLPALATSFENSKKFMEQEALLTLANNKS